MALPKIVSSVIRKQFWSGTVYHVKTIIVEQGRMFVDCESFKTRQDAMRAMPKINRDMIKSIRMGVL
jgi:hypothetical protein